MKYFSGRLGCRLSAGGVGVSKGAAWFREYVAASWVANAAGFVTIFFGVIFVAGVAGRIARWKAAGLQWDDRELGAAFGETRALKSCA